MSKETKATKQTLVPEIRFEGFSGEWIEQPFGYFYHFKNGLNKGKEFFGYGNPIVNYTDVFNNRILMQGDLTGRVSVDNKELNNYCIQKGDILFTRTSETLEEIGLPAVILNDVDNTVFSGFLLRARAYNVDPLDNQFKSYVFFTEFFRQEMKNKSSISTRALTSGTSISKMIFRYPTELSEQESIGKFMVDLDRSITELGKSLSKLQNFKQAMLQKLFPKEGEKEPEMRFEGFEGEWEECIINDIGMIITGNTPSTSEASNYTDNGIPWITPTDIKSNSNVRAAKTLSNDGAKKARVVPKGSILVTCIASIGKNTIVLEESGFNQQINAVIPNNELDSYFLLALSVHWSNTMKKIAGAGTMDIVNRTEFSKIKTYIPHYTEQKQIGDYFYKLDQNIQSKQAELKKLKQFKQAMLSKLFV